MGFLFTGSLAFYSFAMSHLVHKQQIIGWPIFMLAIILACQLWGFIFGEMKKAKKNMLFLSISLLIATILLLAIKT